MDIPAEKHVADGAANEAYEHMIIISEPDVAFQRSVDREAVRAYEVFMRTPSGVSLWGAGSENLAEPLDPQALEKAHKFWANDVEEFGPWECVDFCHQSVTFRGGAPVVVCGNCTSSLDVARYFIDNFDLPEWGAVLAVSQSAGRGQLRRPWVSRPGNLLAAWRWPKPEGCWDSIVPLLAGAVVADALERQGFDVSVKWPNDIMVGDRKVGGILVEEREGQLVVGVGLNVADAPGRAEMREEFSPPAASLSEFGEVKSIISLWHSIVNGAENWYRSKVSGGNPKEFLDALTPRLAWLGREVRVRGSRDDFDAVVLGLAPDGGLVLGRGGRSEVLHSGSIGPR